MLERTGMRPWRFWQRNRVRDWSLIVIIYSTDISACWREILLAWGPEDSGRERKSGIGGLRHHLQYRHKRMLKRDSNGMMPWRFWQRCRSEMEAFLSTYGAAVSACWAETPKAWAPEDLAETQGPGLELSCAQVQYRHKRMLKRDSNGMQLLG